MFIAKWVHSVISWDAFLSVCLFLWIVHFFADVFFGFTEDDYRTNEGGQLPVGVLKGSRIASPVTLTISPLTVDEVIASGGSVPLIPEDNPFAPSRASELFTTTL